MKNLLVLGAAMMAMTACSASSEQASDGSSTTSTTAATTAAPAVTSSEAPAPAPPASPATTTPPGGRMNALFCQLSAYNGGPYYLQVFNPKQPPGMCTAAERDFTQEEFQDVAGLKRRCILDRDEQIAQKHAIVSIYSDGTAQSVEAARIMCTSTGNEFTE